MPKRFNSSATMFVYLNGHHLLEYYFGVADTRMSANDFNASRFGAQAGKADDRIVGFERRGRDLHVGFD